MENTFLMIQNPGVAPEEAFTLLGASTKRGGDNTAVIGKFGTGNKQAIAVLLRHDIQPVVFAGSLKMEFGTRCQKVNDGMRESSFNRVFVKFGGKDVTGSSRTSTDDLGYVLEHGSTDWDDPKLGLREFVSNALDRAVEQGEYDHMQNWIVEQGADFAHKLACNYVDETKAYKAELKRYRDSNPKDYKNVVIKIVDESQVRAKAGFTRIFVPMTADVFEFYRDIDKWFLHFKSDHLLNETLLPKANRNIENKQTAVIYRRGVRVREVTSDKASLFDYNLEDLPLDEARKASDFNVTWYAAKALAKSSVECLSAFFQSCIEMKSAWEQHFPYGLDQECQNADVKSRWQQAWERVVGQQSVISTVVGGEVAKRKGYKVVEVNQFTMDAAKKYGIPTPADVLSGDDLVGRDILEPTKATTIAFDWAWDLCVKYNQTKGKAKPEYKSYRHQMTAGSQILGFHRNGAVYLNLELVDQQNVDDWRGLPRAVLTTALEEIAHYITEATDNSRDFQEFFINMIVLMAKQ